ncbi:DUF3800 domain-containing protein [Riemerella anatipestifer]|uniref:DUF3800 domain-containing protein n=1 Tax=Riemerella anatipestifer TaxID=34085 RepID=UPI0030C61EE5
MRNIIAFADEFGNNSFNFESQGTHFIVASVMVNGDELEDFENSIERIRKKYFQTGEIKSSKIGNNYKRRLLILRDLENVKFSVYAVIVDKRKLYGEGFKYKQSFYKFLNGLLYKELYRTFPQLELKVDEHGKNDFMKSFKKYVQNNHISTLFFGADFNIKQSHNELGIQLADFYAGSLGYVFDESKRNENSDKLLEKLQTKITSLNLFPKKYTFEDDKIENQFYNEYDSNISTLSLTRIYDLIENLKPTSQENIDRINFLKLLLLYNQSNHPNKYTTSKDFIKHLNVNREKEMSKEYFATKIIGNLRDKGVIIATSRDGYKIPNSLFDIKKFVEHGNSIIFPLIRRISECRNAILLSTRNECDILEDVKFEKLKKIIKDFR